MREFGDSAARGVVDVVKHFHAPRQTLGTWATQPFIAEPIEPEIPKFNAFPVFALSKCIKFRVQFIEKVAVLLCHWMGLHQVCPNGDHPSSLEDDAAMALRPVNVQAEFLCKAVDVARTVDVLHAVRAYEVL